MKAWTFQDPKQKAKHGAKKCPWSVGWYDARGRQRRKSIGTKTAATAYARKLEGEAAAGLLKSFDRVKWDDFVDRFTRDHLDTISPKSKAVYLDSLERFAKVVKVATVDQVDSATIDRFRAKRLKEGVGASTVNKDLRHIRCALNKARKWKLIPERVEVELLREPEKDPEFIDDATFAKLYKACDAVGRPHGRNYPAADWWRALFVFAYLTGWRISQTLSLRREDLDLAEGVAFVEAERTKGKRDARIQLHPVVVEHLKAIAGFEPLVFSWPHHERTLYADFKTIKEAAEVEFTGAFHRFRFGFANANVDALDAETLQQLMQHKDPQTTRRYVNLAAKMKRQQTADMIHVPEVLAKKA